MSKVIASEFVTLDGVFQDPGGAGEFEHGGWTFRFDRGSDGNQVKLDEVMSAGALMLGRVTYEAFAQAWPSMKDEFGFADKMNSMPKYVVSRTLTHAEWNNSTIITSNMVEEVNKLKQLVSGDILINGSGQLVRELMEHDLIDEYRLMVFPIVLGSGKRLFTDAAKATTLRLTDTRWTGDVVFLTYEPARVLAETK